MIPEMLRFAFLSNQADRVNRESIDDFIAALSSPEFRPLSSSIQEHVKAYGRYTFVYQKLSSRGQQDLSSHEYQPSVNQLPSIRAKPAVSGLLKRKTRTSKTSTERIRLILDFMPDMDLIDGNHLNDFERSVIGYLYHSVIVGEKILEIQNERDHIYKR